MHVVSKDTALCIPSPTKCRYISSVCFVTPKHLRKYLLKRGSLVFHKMRKVQLFEHKRIYYPTEVGIILDFGPEISTVFWKDFGIREEENHYLESAN